MSVAFCSLLFVPCRASSNAVKRDISITKGMELNQLLAEYVYYLRLAKYCERPAIKKERKGKLISNCLAETVSDKCVASDLNHNMLRTRDACIIIIRL